MNKSNQTFRVDDIVINTESINIIYNNFFPYLKKQELN